MITYKATGIVLGNYWGGGSGGYVANEIRANSLSELRDKINAGIVGGSLDSGMGYESLIGAIMTIETIDSREIDGKIFIAADSEIETFGNLTEEQDDFLVDCLYNY